MMHPDVRSLIQGYKKFYIKHFNSETSAFREIAKTGQKPKFLVIACSDSRVDPSLLLDCKPGDLFIIRNVANLVPPYEIDGSYHGTSAALEFGVCALNIPHIILIGHTQCGGIQALMQSTQKLKMVDKWLQIARGACHPPVDRIPFSESAIVSGQNSLKNSLINLHTFPWIDQRVKEGSLHLHAWNLHLSTGILEVYDKKEDIFKPAAGQSKP